MCAELPQLRKQKHRFLAALILTVSKTHKILLNYFLFYFVVVVD